MCALFAYGNSSNILNFLKKLDFSLLTQSEQNIKKACKGLKYRFENEEDIAQIFITLKRAKQSFSLQDRFYEAFRQNKRVDEGLSALIRAFYELNTYSSYGYEFFFGKAFKNQPKSPLKRYNMFLRWCVRKDELDLGLWECIKPASLLIPLDTHTHKVSLHLGLLKRRQYDFKAVLELSQSLRELDPLDPIKYDFALYRLGQSGEYISFGKN